MSIISKCPRCRQQVTVPDRLDPQSRVRCPLCDAEYPLSEAMAEAPPALILVDAPAAQEIITEPEAVSAAEVVPEAERVSESPEAEMEVSGDQRPAIDVWQKVDAMPQIDTGAAAESPPAIDTGQTPVDTEAFAGVAEAEAEDEYGPVEGAPTKERRKKKRKRKSMGRHMVEALVGGFFGLTIGYYALAWIGGSRLDLPRIRFLPFLPRSMGEAAQPDKENVQETDDKPAKPPPMKSYRLKPRPSSQPESPQPSPKEGEDHTAGPGGSSAEPPTTRPHPKPGPQPRPLPADYVGPRDPPSFSSDEFGGALKAANEAVHGEDATGEMTPEAYAAFCRMAHVLTFVDQGAQLADRKLAIQDLLEEIAAAPGQINEVARLAGSLLDREDRPGDGILLAGTVRVVGIRDGVQGATVQLAALPVAVTVMSKPPLPLGQNDEVLILGSLVDEPSENFVGYDGSKKLLIWGAMAARVRE